MAAVVVVFDGGSSIWRRSMASAMGYNEGGARTGNATTSHHDERTRGRCNERKTRDDGATTSWSWRDETIRDGPTRRRDDEMTRR